MSAKSTFDIAINRSEHFLTIYDLLHNQRKRAVKSNWTRNFKLFMGWKIRDPITRIDGKSSMLIIQNMPQLKPSHFDHNYVSELLRASVVAAVSALDRYMHDLVLENSWKLLSKSEANIPKELKKLNIPALEVKRALTKIKKDPKARPGNQIKKAIQVELHSSTFQGSGGIDKCVALLGVANFWTNVSNLIQGNPGSKAVQDQLNKIVNRRNQIVHEADLERKISSKKDMLRDITRKNANDYVTWIRQFVSAVDQLPI